MMAESNERANDENGPPEGIVDQALEAAAGTRNAARWLASALGAVPSLAILSSVVRAPSSAGFDAITLALGVGFAALGAIVGVLGFARVLAPVPLEDKDLTTFDLRRIPGQPFATYEDLSRDMNLVRNAAAEQEHNAAELLQMSKRTEALAIVQDVEAAKLESQAKGSPNNSDLQQRAQEARADADAAKQEAAKMAANAAAQAAGASVWAKQFAGREAIRQEAFQLKAADEVGRRFTFAQTTAVISVISVATGIVLLGLAPKPESTTSEGLPRLVTLTLNEAGMQALDCELESVRALQIGGDESTPLVVTLPTAQCPAQAVEFSSSSREGLGVMTPAETIKAEIDE